MQDNTESKRLNHLSEDGQEFIFENDKMYKVRDSFVLPDGETAHLVNEVVAIPDIEDRPPYDTKLIMDIKEYYQNCVATDNILKQWYEMIAKKLDGWIEAENYYLGKKYITDKVFYQYADTEYFIRLHIEDEDWYDVITDYIEYNIDSFGMVKGQTSGFGSGAYVQLVHHFIKGCNINKAPQNKDKLLDYLTPYIDINLKSETGGKDLIIETYKTWTNLFPFELSHFSDIKNKYLDNLPILYKIPPHINRFTKNLTATLYTQNDVISFLINETDKLHREFNGTVLFEKGLLTDANRNLIELANKTRLLKLEELNKKTSFESTVLEKINHWLKCEKEYINEMKDLIIVSPTTATEQPPNKKPIKEKPVISFKAMFINPSEYDKVLGYVSEYLTETKQWKESIIYLSAFYGVLRDRGYLNTIYKAPQINSTLKNEFGIDAKTTDKNFQDEKINNAVATYAEAFNMIPSLKSTK